MKENWESSLAHTLKLEGGFTNHPSDPGGITNLGVTKKVWEEYAGHPVDEAFMRTLTPEIVAPLYRARYWNLVKADELPSGVDYVVFDCAVNSGVGRSVKFLQQVLHVYVDGFIGPMTLAAAKASDTHKLINMLCDTRQAFLQSLRTFDVFGKGWTARVVDVRAHGHSLVK